MIVGAENHQYEAVPGWGSERPMGVVTAVAVDSQDRVYALDREPDPAVVVFDREGHLLGEWGHDILVLPHELWIDSQDRIYIPDCGDHTVRVFTAAGELLQTLGTPGRPGALGQPFNQPTRVVQNAAGEFYVADGYGQCYVHHLAADGTLLRTWGGEGSPMLEFRLKLDGIEAIECVSYQMTAELSAGTNAETAGTVKLRCGESLGMYLILPMEFIDCDESLFDLHIAIMVEGFGTRTYDVQFQGGGSFWC